MNAKGEATAIKHYSMGRLSFERTTVMPDNRTVYIGDDGGYTMMFMYIADQAKDLSAGTLYAAKWIQTDAKDGGAANLKWIKLGHAADKEIKELAQSLTFSDIFETSSVPADGFTPVRTSSSGGKTEYLKVRPGMEKAAAFLESRRYGAIKGATSEFNKMEAVEYNKTDNKVYMAMSYIEKGMLQGNTDPVDDIHVDKISAGGVYELSLTKGQKDSESHQIDSNYVAGSIDGLVMGEDLAAADENGNTANVDKIANPDNIVYSGSMRTLFIAEDSSMHSNNFAWAYNIDTKKLSRIVSVPGGGEATGLQLQQNLHGYTYLMVSSQNPGHVGYLQLPQLTGR
ncbi:alkaline phosphatase PhoX [Sporolactobacillus sp. Y61]|uniref:Alkaline phosphatase PhoX n=1 Tax=Sporolactobacillus sp. Y61 TaxID=3160863 RepID=A0AAU8IFP0_9BACL